MKILTEKCRKLKNDITCCLTNYCATSSLHGLRYISDTKRTGFERLTWFLILCICISLTIHNIANGISSYQKAPTMTTIENNYHPISNIPFPGVTFCNTNFIMKSSALIVAEKVAAFGISQERVLAFLKTLPNVYLNQINFTTYIDVMRALENLGYTLPSLLFDLSQPCSRLLQTCTWKGFKLNCSEMFVDLVTPTGFCCAFNYHGESFEGYSDLIIRKNHQDEKWTLGKRFSKMLFVDEASLSSAGLQVVLDSEQEDFFASHNFFGTLVMVHHPNLYPDISASKTYVQPRFDVKIRTTASVVASGDDLRDLPPERRNCFFNDEVNALYPSGREGPIQQNALQKASIFLAHTPFPSRRVTFEHELPYSYDTCTLLCKLAIFESLCNCVPFYYAQNVSTRVCGAVDSKCVNRHSAITNNLRYRSKYNHIIRCQCLESCNDVSYDFDSDGNQIYSEQWAPQIFEGNLNNKSVVSIYFKDDTCIKYRRVSQMHWESLIASFGGILGLYLGGSVISVIEIVYYATVQLWRQLRKKENTHYDRRHPHIKQLTLSNQWPAMTIPVQAKYN